MTDAEVHEFEKGWDREAPDAPEVDTPDPPFSVEEITAAQRQQTPPWQVLYRNRAGRPCVLVYTGGDNGTEPMRPLTDADGRVRVAYSLVAEGAEYSYGWENFADLAFPLFEDEEDEPDDAPSRSLTKLTVDLEIEHTLDFDADEVVALIEACFEHGSIREAIAGGNAMSMYGYSVRLTDE